MKRLSANDIKNLPSVPEEDIELEEWGFSIKIRGINKAMQVQLGKLLNQDDADAFDYQRELLKVCVIEPELDDELIDQLYEKDSRVIDKIFLKINELNGVGGSAEAEDFETDLDLTFRFKLARELGMTVGELMTTMSSMEYNQWIAYYKWETGEINKARALAEAEAKKNRQR